MPTMMNQRSSQTAAILSILVALVVGLGATPARAQDKEPQPLTRKLATRLIADFYEIGLSEVKIAYIPGLVVGIFVSWRQ